MNNLQESKELNDGNLPPAKVLLQAGPVDLERILDAWNTATERLQQTHQALRSEVKRLTDELEIKNRELARKNRLADLGQLASHIAHEVRNSLMPMTLYSTLLRRRLSADRDSLETLDKIDSGLTALDATVNDLLHFTTDREPDRTTFLLGQLVDEVHASLAPQLDAQHICVTTSIPSGLTISADREMLRRALLNLFLNALDAMSTGGVLQIKVVKSPSAIQLEVADNGTGISNEHVGRLFEPFFTTKGGGTGLGLAIVERIATTHGGTITARRNDDRGAAFTLSIPYQRKRVAA